MWRTLRRYGNFFLIGFVVAFIIYLFVRYNADQILLGLAISAAVGLVVCIAIFLLERRFPEREPLNPDHR